jgi:serine/threonine protein kinase
MDYYYGVCPECNQPNTGFAWCNKCDPGKFLKEGKTSGNPEIDNLIYDSQLKTKHYSGVLEWIPYDRFQDIKPIGEGGFANIYSATWLDGGPDVDYKNNNKIRTGPVTVALKKLKNSDNMEAFINEVKIFKLFYFNLFILIIICFIVY